ncbi:MAG: IS110 family transposase, partial [Butyrivibrio sp.]|nr:IS110 family transposase [Butyrivibrio sp.]
MIYVGIDVAKDKHDCCILGSDGEVLFSPFTIKNSLQGFDELYDKICSLSSDSSEIKVGLEATGHYHMNLLRSLLDNGLDSYVINPLHTNLFRKGQSLRKTKTDKVDASSIAMMLLTDKTLKPYS